MRNFDVAIVGAGVMGAAAACELAREGLSVALIDQSALPNPRAASVDHSKVFRFAYPDPFYVRLAMDSLKRWCALEEETGTPLLTQTGALLIGKRRPSFETECYEAMLNSGCEAEMLDHEQVAARFPQFNAHAFEFGVFDPSGAITHAEIALRALIELARRRGVRILENTRVIDVRNTASRVVVACDSASDIECERAMIASGPWSRKLLPFLADRLTTTRQELVYFEPAAEISRSFEPSAFPIFLELESGFYGFPIHHNGSMKIANHLKGAVVDPDALHDEVDDSFIGSCRTFFNEFIPALADARVRETRVCIYNNTPDDDFIIDWHPTLEGVLVVTGFSGHGFKFGPAVGRIGAELLHTGRCGYETDRFRLFRFDKGDEVSK
ncbi:MAG TPA: N-methyl-L-tryptophan oxidase [Blastocatellia bacterium]|nr:N-methyl-L-tryptophan oxidase [Blastocatellia bacterium]